ncbi:MAG: hypothetical protein J6Y78_11515 [Paludibacteraceae bacterium]|nr:hypothetical protein [Paludibacteraceae bacterium]
MIRLKVDIDSQDRPILILYLDGEFQTIYGNGNECPSVESCIERAREIRKVIPFQQLDITEKALSRLTVLHDCNIVK